jgi:signal transduction histidine kinase/ligand-binding sensor domain-containing protein
MIRKNPYIFSGQFYKVGLVLILTILFTNVSSQITTDKKYKFRWLTVENGLSNNRVTDISKCKEGYIWLGTDDGINRFDGINTKYYEANNGNTEFDKWNRLITSIYNDSTNGNLWIGAYTLFTYNYEKDSITPYFPANSVNQPNRIRAIAQTGDILWIGARQGLYSIDLKTKKTLFYPPAPKQNLKLEIWDMSISEDKIWIVTEENGLYVFDIKTRKYTNIPLVNSRKEPIKNLLCIHADNENLIWVGTKDEGLYTYNIYNGSFSYRNLSPESSRIRKIKADKSGNIWFGTFNGLFFKKKNSPEIIRIAHENDPISKISHNSVHNLYIDNHDILWLSTFAGGACYTDLRQKSFFHIPAGSDERFINSPTVTNFTEDRYGNLYIATDTSGINILDKKTGKFSILPIGDNTVRGNFIKAIVFDSRNNLWIGSNQGGVTMYNITSKTFKYYKTKGKEGYTLQSNLVNSLVVDEMDNVWVGSTKGVDKITHNGRVERVHSDPTIHYLFKGPKGTIWNGTSDDSIFVFSNNSNKFEPFIKDFNVISFSTLYCDSKNHLWIGQKSGLICVDLKSKKHKHYTLKDGLPNNVIQSIVEDNNQNIWIGTSSGLAKCEKAVIKPFNFLIKRFSKEDGLQGEYFNKSSVFKSRSGQLYFGGTNGFNMFIPDSIKDDPNKPDIVFNKLEISNKEITLQEPFDGKILLNNTLSHTRQIELSYKHKSIYIEFVSLYFGDPKNIQYAYMLYPLQKSWQYTRTPRNFATFYSIPDGDYVFKVKAANSDGLWNTNPIELKIKIIPPFWKRIWVMISGLLIFIILIISIINYRVYSIKKQKVLLEKLIDERTLEITLKNQELENQRSQILQQSIELKTQKDDLEELNKMKDKLFSIIAHDIKNPFNAVLGFSEILLTKFKTLNEEKKYKYIELINQSSVKIFSLLENLLFWARAQINIIPFHPVQSNISDLIQQNIKLLEADCWKKNIIIESNLPNEIWVEIDTNMMNAVLRNILSNAIKFSKMDGKIKISHEIVNGFLRLTITDQGVGIPDNNLKELFKVGHSYKRIGTAGEEGTGLGLLICKEFIEKHGGKINVTSEVEKGTSFNFTMPIKY